jgi:beta-glucosidase
MFERGYALGAEAKALGVHVQLGPVAGPLGKIPYGGRNWEGFSPDPYLTGIAMQATINGMQSAGVQVRRYTKLPTSEQKLMTDRPMQSI